METQPTTIRPSRFRLATQAAPPPPPQPQQPPAPRPLLRSPVVRPVTPPPPPPPQPVAQPQPLPPLLPPPPPVATTPATTITITAIAPPVQPSSVPSSPRKRPTPPPSPQKIVAPSQPSFSPTPPPSPKKSPPPPPLQLNPAPEPEPEPKKLVKSEPVVAEQKSIVVQQDNANGKKTFEEPHTQRHVGSHKNDTKDEDGGMKVITLAGDNKGAYMELGSSDPKKSHHLVHHPRHHSNPSGTEGGDHVESDRSDEGKSKKKEKSKSKAPPLSAVVNSNVQSVNNSLMFNSSCAHHDPGVHLAVSRKPMSSVHSNHQKLKGHANGHTS